MFAAKQRKKHSVQKRGAAKKDMLLRAAVNAGAGITSFANTDPVGLVRQCFCRRFDAVGKARAEETALKGGDTAKRAAAEETAQKNSGFENNKNTDSSRYFENKRSTAGMKKQHESRRNIQNAAERSVGEKFSSYAFRGGKLAGAILDGNAKAMFITCIQRAYGVPEAENEKQRGLPSEPKTARAGNTTAYFSRDVYSAVGIAADAVRGASSVLDAFRSIAEGKDRLEETSLNVNTVEKVYPFLKTSGDKAVIESLKAKLKSFEGAKSPEEILEKQRLVAALNKANAVLNEKKEEQRSFLTVITTMQERAREAEKLFSGGVFARETVEEPETTVNAEPPPEKRKNNRVRRSLNVPDAKSENNETRTETFSDINGSSETNISEESATAEKK